MKYLLAFFLYLLSVYFFFSLIFFDNQWHYVQPLLITVLLIYFNTSHSWLPYLYALLAGFLVDSVSAVFGLQALIFITIIFCLRTLQYTIITFRNILSVIILSVFSLVLFWLLFYILDFIMEWPYYDLSQLDWGPWSRGLLINFSLIIVLHLLYYNLWLKKHERQSF